MRLTLVHLDVDRTPPDIVLRGLLEDDTLVLGGTAGFLARKVDESAVAGDDSTLIPDGILVKLGDRSIPAEVDLAHVKASL